MLRKPAVAHVMHLNNVGRARFVDVASSPPTAVSSTDDVFVVTLVFVVKENVRFKGVLDDDLLIEKVLFLTSFSIKRKVSLFFNIIDLVAGFEKNQGLT